MDTTELLAFCDKNPILQELARKFWRDQAALTSLHDAGISFASHELWGKCDAFKEAMDCALRLIQGSSDAFIRDAILHLFQPDRMRFQ